MCITKDGWVDVGVSYQLSMKVNRDLGRKCTKTDILTISVHSVHHVALIQRKEHVDKQKDLNY